MQEMASKHVKGVGGGAKKSQTSNGSNMGYVSEAGTRFEQKTANRRGESLGVGKVPQQNLELAAMQIIPPSPHPVSLQALHLSI